MSAAPDYRYGREVSLAVGLFGNLDDSYSQDAVLHQIFTLLLDVADEFTPAVATEVIYSLYRLYYSEGWEPARTYFYVCTGHLLQKDVPRLELRAEHMPSLELDDGDAVLLLDARTIHAECDRRCRLLNSLWFDSESHYGSKDEDEDEDEDEDVSDVESAESDIADDLRHCVMPQWVVSDSVVIENEVDEPDETDTDPACATAPG